MQTTMQKEATTHNWNKAQLKCSIVSINRTLRNDERLSMGARTYMYTAKVKLKKALELW